jgi:hypothetical protein
MENQIDVDVYLATKKTINLPYFAKSTTDKFFKIGEDKKGVMVELSDYSVRVESCSAQLAITLSSQEITEDEFNNVFNQAINKLTE